MKNLNLIKRLWTDSHEKQSPQRFARYAAILIMLLTLSVGQMWAWTDIWLMSDVTSWSNRDCQLSNPTDGENYVDVYIATNQCFKFWVYASDSYNKVVGPSSDQYEMGINSGNSHFTNEKWSNAAKYTGNNGIVRFNAKQVGDGNEDAKPWVWLERPQVVIKHDFVDGDSWEQENMVDNNDGTYVFIGTYNGTGVNVGTSEILKYISSPTINNTNSTISNGTRCFFDFNASTFKGNIGDENENTGSVTITRAITVTFNRNGHGTAPDNQEIRWNTTAEEPSDPSEDGYTFGGWFEEAECENEWDFDDPIAPNTSSKTLYAKWTENSYSLTFATDGHGTVAVGGDAVASGSTANVNHHTTKTLVATNNTGYQFSSWTLSGDNTSAVTIGNTSNASTTIKTSGTGATVTANFSAKNYSVTLDKTTGSNGGTATATYNATSLSSIDAPEKTGYHVEGYYDSYTSVPEAYGNKVASDAGALQANVTGFTGAGGIWTKDADATLYTKWDKNTYTITFDKNLTGLTTYVGAVSGTTANKAATYDESATLTTNGYSRDGYDFVGWNTQADTAGTSYADKESVSNLTTTNGGTVTLYAKWKSKTYTVTLNATQNGGSCATTSTVVTMGSTYGAGTAGSLPTASAPSGYRFAGWYTAATDGTKIEDATQVTTHNDHTLYAHFTEVTYVYFYNNLNWANVYVTYDAYWDKDHTPSWGAGNKDKIYHQMLPIEEGSKIYRDEIPADVIASWKYNICFNSQQLGKTNSDYSGDYSNFDKGKAVFRRDFDSYATMFIPHSSDPNKFTLNNGYAEGTEYHSTDQWVDKDGDDIIDYRYKNGYWVKYNRYISGDAGFVIKGKWDNESNDFYFRKTTEGNSYTFTKYLPASTTYKFRIYKHCKTTNTYSSWFIGNKDATITSSITDWNLSNAIDKGHTDWYDQLTTTIAGDYEFKITCNTDNGTVTLSVTYPGLTVDDNWYRLVYSWNDGSAHSRVCETFQRTNNTGSEWVDAFIHKAASPIVSRSLQLQKYVTVSSTPTWQNVGDPIDLSDITKNGVYTFKVTRPTAAEEPVGSYFGPYEENYLLRCDITAGGWDYYKDIAFGGTQYMTYSDFSARQTTDPYTHYYCQYVDNSTQNVAFTIATYNTPSICDTLVNDAIIGEADDAATKYKHLPSGNPANIRFMYNDSLNTVKRAYLKAAQGDGNTRYLVLHGDSHMFNTDESAISADGSKSLAANELLFTDKGNWIYEINLKASPVAKAKIIAQYNGSDRYLIGGLGDTSADWKTILGAPADDLSHKYALAGTYDFKTNRLMVAWTPDGTDIIAKLSDIDMLWVRVGDGAATQINFGEGGSLSKVSAIGAIKINWSDVNGQVGSWNDYTRRYAKYFVSFPFDVKVSDIFGLNKAVMGREYVIQKYNGAKRAKDGLFLGDDATFWENLTIDSTMHANEGYLVMFDNDYLNSDSWSIWDNNKGDGKAIYLYFPAAAMISSIANSATTTTVAAHQSERKETWTDGSGTHKMSDTDSHWNLIGGPFFHNATISSSTPGGDLSALHSYYRPKTDNTWEACVLGTPKVADTDVINNAFKAMSCIMVQWHGTLTWNTTTTTPAFVAARHTEEQKNYLIQLDLTRGEEYSDHAFVDLKERANSDFVLCEDMMKIVRNGLPNVYVYAGANDVAYSQVPEENQTIPVGVIIPQNGIYTFTMPTNFSGTVTLVDTYAQTRTNLGLGDYEIYLENGTINDRFFLEININNAPTAIDGTTDGEGTFKDGKAHKFIQNGQMYILENGRLYDARGSRVK